MNYVDIRFSLEEKDFSDFKLFVELVQNMHLILPQQILVMVGCGRDYTKMYGQGRSLSESTINYFWNFFHVAACKCMWQLELGVGTCPTLKCRG